MAKALTVASLVKESAKAPPTLESFSAASKSRFKRSVAIPILTEQKTTIQIANTKASPGYSKANTAKVNTIMKKARPSWYANASVIPSKLLQNRRAAVTREPENEFSKKRMDCAWTTAKHLCCKSRMAFSSKNAMARSYKYQIICVEICNATKPQSTQTTDSIELSVSALISPRNRNGEAALLSTVKTTSPTMAKANQRNFFTLGQ